MNLVLDPVDDPRADVRGFLQLGWHLVEAEALQAAGRLPAAATAVRSLRRALRRRGFHGQGLRLLDQLALAFDDGRAGAEACPAMIDYLHSAWHRPLATPDTSASEADDAHSPAAG